jgi:KOW motif
MIMKSNQSQLDMLHLHIIAIERELLLLKTGLSALKTPTEYSASLASEPSITPKHRDDGLASISPTSEDESEKSIVGNQAVSEEDVGKHVAVIGGIYKGFVGKIVKIMPVMVRVDMTIKGKAVQKNVRRSNVKWAPLARPRN